MQVTNKPHDNHSGRLSLSLTLSYGLVLIIGQRGDKEVHLSHGAPVVQDAHAPHTRPQRLVERWAVVGVLCAGVDQNVIGGRDDVGGVDPHDRDGDVRALTPLLHAHRLVHGAHQAAEVSEHALFGVPLCTDLTTGEQNKEMRGSENKRTRVSDRMR